jgi:transcriptional regulator with XRE-family HTH domain
MSAMSFERDDLRRRVRDERKRRRWNQQELAQQSSVSKRTIWGFETGNSWPHEDNLEKILEAVGLQSLNKLQGLSAVGGTASAGYDADADVRRQTVESWPLAIRVFLDALGAYLMTLSEDEQEKYIRDEMLRIMSSRRQ